MTQRVVDPNPSISSATRRLIADRCPGQREATRLKAELSKLLDCSPITLNAKLRGDRVWDALEVAKLATFFDKPPAYFYEDGEQDHFLSRVSRNPPPDQRRRQRDQLPYVVDVECTTFLECEPDARYSAAA